MAGHRPWRELRDTSLPPEARARAAATLLYWALNGDAYGAARRAVREELGFDPDRVPHRPLLGGGAGASGR